MFIKTPDAKSMLEIYFPDKYSSQSPLPACFWTREGSLNLRFKMETFHFNDAQYVNLCDVFDSFFLLTNQKTL